MNNLQLFYEVIRSEGNCLIKAFIHSINEFEMHLHKEMEIILVLKGSVNIRVCNELYELNESDLILINSNEIHSINRGKEDNIILSIQIDTLYYSSYSPQFNKLKFDCKAFFYSGESQKHFNIVRYYLAKIVWELNKKRKGYELILGSEIHLLAAYLVSNFEHHFMEEEKETSLNKDLVRIQSIIGYIHKNIERRITLQEIADREKLNVYYLSHFFKRKIGKSFQQYLSVLRLDKAVSLLINTNRTITEIAYSSGFPSSKGFNKKFKEVYCCSPTEYRKKYNIYFSKKRKNKKLDFKFKRGKSSLEMYKKIAFQKLFVYLRPFEKKSLLSSVFPEARKLIQVRVKEKGTYRAACWRKVITYSGLPYELKKGWKNKLKELHQEVEFEYFRLQDLFSIGISTNVLGNDYNWSHIDRILDFIKKLKLKPYIDLECMYRKLKDKNELELWIWINWLIEFIRHSIERYGLKEVLDWNFEIGNDSSLLSILNFVSSKVGKIDIFQRFLNSEDQLRENFRALPKKHFREIKLSIFDKSLIQNTLFMAAFMIRDILKYKEQEKYLGDIYLNAESQTSISTSHGNFDLFNKYGLKNPVYFAYLFLSKLGKELLEQGEDYIITKEDAAIQFLCFNIDVDYITSVLSNAERYSVNTTETAGKGFELNIEGVAGNYKLTRYQLNREHGSVYDEWVRMGAPEKMNHQEIIYLKGKVHPKIIIEYLQLYGEYQEKMYVPVQGVELLLLERV